MEIQYIALIVWLIGYVIAVHIDIIKFDEEIDKAYVSVLSIMWPMTLTTVMVACCHILWKRLRKYIRGKRNAS